MSPLQWSFVKTLVQGNLSSADRALARFQYEELYINLDENMERAYPLTSIDDKLYKMLADSKLT